MSKLNIKVKGFDHSLVDLAAKKSFQQLKKKKLKLVPIPLPTKRDEVTILRSVHVNKTSREQFESRTHQRLVVINSASAQLTDKINRLELPVGVAIQVKVK